MDAPREFIGTNDVDGATKAIFRDIQRNLDRRVIYFHGWSGLGASVVLRSVAKRLTSRREISELCFDRTILIDCSEWKSRRSMQRAIAEELKLDRSTMAILDKQDEEDDFHGVYEISRNEITSVSRRIHRTLKDSRFAVVFYNGSNTEVDLNNFGIPQFDQFSDNILFWTFTRRILTIKEHEEYEQEYKLRLTRVLAYDRVTYLTSEQFYALLRKEAAMIAAGIDPAMVADCFLYNIFLQTSFRTTAEHDWAGHAFNCWICDGILHEDISREISNVLNRQIRLEYNASLLDDVITKFKKHLKLPFVRVRDHDVYEEGPYRWISITSKDTKLHGIQIIPAQTSSFILEFDRSELPLAMPNRMFEHSRSLGVLILCCCDFNFASPPFAKCHSLKFLGLDHCSDNKTCGVKDHTEWACLHRLRVLDLCSTFWHEILSQEKIDLMNNIRELNIEGFMSWQYITHLQGRLPNLEKLRITNPTSEPEISRDTTNSFVGKTKLEILDLSGNSDMEILPSSLSEVSSLEVLVLDGCSKLQVVVVSDMFPHLRSFRLDGHGPSTRRTPTIEQPTEHLSPCTSTVKNGAASISKIILRGCTELDNVFLRGLPNLVELDLSGSAIKFLDFDAMVVEVPGLRRLFLLGCEHLVAIIWGDTGKFDLELLCIDTRAGTDHRHWPPLGRDKPLRLQVHAVVEDARLGWSLWWSPIRRGMASTREVCFNIHVTSSSHVYYNGSKAICEEKRCGPAARKYIDVLSMVSDALMRAFPDPSDTNLDRRIEISEGVRGLESALQGNSRHYSLADIMKRHTNSVHVHDVSVTGMIMPMGRWDELKQCRMERCPKLVTVFPWDSYGFNKLETFWALDLLMARQIWSKGGSRDRTTSSFQNLKHLHLSSCPRLQYVLPVWVCAFPSLETLHIIHCGDLKHIFVMNGWYPEEIATNGVPFPKLTTIHLHDLPKLQQICEMKMVVPALESIKIRGCFGIHRLPFVNPGVKKPTVEIEKDVWDALEWDGGHHPSHFQAPVHSRYYKKKLPRTSVLR
ncbi:unnamed protein product [Alopecurus aequalis]